MSTASGLRARRLDSGKRRDPVVAQDDFTLCRERLIAGRLASRARHRVILEGNDPERERERLICAERLQLGLRELKLHFIPCSGREAFSQGSARAFQVAREDLF